MNMHVDLLALAGAKPAPPLTPTLDTLPAALRQNVLAYAARKVRAVGKAVDQSQTEAGRIYESLMQKLGAIEGIATDAAAGVVTIKGKEAAEVVQMMAIDPATTTDTLKTFADMATVDSGVALLRDSKLATVFADLNKHFKGNPIPTDLAQEAFGHVKHLMETDVDAVKGLLRHNIAPTIGEAASNIVKLTDYRKVAFAAVAGVACGVVMKDILFPHKDPSRQPQLA